MKTIRLEKSEIPQGSYCYSKREYIPEEDCIRLLDLCPYWKHTDHGTVCCEYLKLESVENTEEGYIKALSYFGSEDILDEKAPLLLLWNQVKECGINDEWDEAK